MMMMMMILSCNVASNGRIAVTSGQSVTLFSSTVRLSDTLCCNGRVLTTIAYSIRTSQLRAEMYGLIWWLIFS